MSENEVIMVTGGAQGIGLAEVEAFIATGAKVAVADVDLPLAQQVASRWPGQAYAIDLDVSDEEQWGRAAEQVTSELGTITSLVNNAAIHATGDILQAPIADWKRVMDINLIGTLLGIRAVAPGMAKNGSGSIVNTASTAGTRGVMNGSAYSTSKWAVRGLTQSAALDLSVHNIRVNAVVPGVTHTPAMLRAGFPDVLPAQAIGRSGLPAEIAAVVVWLASSAASFVTGAEYIVDGGASAGVVTPG